MSKRKHPTSSDIVNPTLSDSLSSRDRAIILSKKHNDWEKKQKFEVIRPDSKTVIYRKIPKSVELLIDTKKIDKYFMVGKIHNGKI